MTCQYRLGIMFLLLAWMDGARAFAAATQAGSVAAVQGLQPDGDEVWAKPSADDVAGGYWTGEGDSSEGYLVSARKWSKSGLAEPGAVYFRNAAGKIVKTLDLPLKPSTDPRWHADLWANLHAGVNGRFMSVVSIDRKARTTETRILDHRGEEVAVLPYFAGRVSAGGRWATGTGALGVIGLPNARPLRFDIPAQSDRKGLFFSDYDDSFTNWYRHQGTVVLALHDELGTVVWSTSVAAGQYATVKNVVASISGELIAVIAGEVPRDRLLVFDRGGRMLWSRDVESGNYGMAFTGDDRLLFTVFRDSHDLFDARNGISKWSAPISSATGDEDSDLVGSKVIPSADGMRIFVATRSRSSGIKGKKPFQAGFSNTKSGPDLVYAFEADGTLLKILQHPAGFLALTAGRFQLEPAVSVSTDGRKVFFLTKSGLRSKEVP